MEYENIHHITFLVRMEINQYASTIKAYQTRKDTWKDPDTCEKYFRSMNKNEDFIDAAIAFLASNGTPLEKRLITRYEHYQDLRASVID